MNNTELATRKEKKALYRKKWREENRELDLQRKREYRENNKELVRERARLYRLSEKGKMVRATYRHKLQEEAKQTTISKRETRNKIRAEAVSQKALETTIKKEEAVRRKEAEAIARRQERLAKKKTPEELEERRRKYATSTASRIRNTVTRGRRVCTGVDTLTYIELVSLLVGQRHKCNCCGVKISHDLGNINIDHFIPLSRGGDNTLENVQWLCGDCNKKKGANAPIEPLTFSPLKKTLS